MLHINEVYPRVKMHNFDDATTNESIWSTINHFYSSVLFFDHRSLAERSHYGVRKAVSGLLNIISSLTLVSIEIERWNMKNDVINGSYSMRKKSSTSNRLCLYFAPYKRINVNEFYCVVELRAWLFIEYHCPGSILIMW